METSLFRCCKCDMAATWQPRVAVPSQASGSQPVMFVASPKGFCLPHRKMGVPAAELLDDDAKQFLASRMTDSPPAFDKAFVEWALVK